VLEHATQISNASHKQRSSSISITAPITRPSCLTAQRPLHLVGKRFNESQDAFAVRGSWTSWHTNSGIQVQI